MMGEFHQLRSGFGTYSKELLNRLHATGKYELAEFACYAKPGQVDSSIPWRIYTNIPDDKEDGGQEGYGAHPNNSYGHWRFDRVCLDFKPDIVLCYRDPWMDMWIHDAATRPFFHWVWMPTVDSAPQRPEWINIFAGVDAVLTYSEYGTRVLQQQAGDSINCIGCASPGVNSELYKPMERKQLRTELGMSPDALIVGTVMRNQKRKLFLELMKSFRIFLDNTSKDLAEKSFLYLHTSYPDKMGWDIANGILETGLAGKVLMTYVCRTCKKWFPNMFQDALIPCKHCGNKSAVAPTVSAGVSREELAKIYNLFDLYAQYAICEGFGMPQVEAGACGIPVAATDYSAMEDVVRYTKGYPIPVKTMFRELETNAERAYPDNDAMAQIIEDHFSLSEAERVAKSIDVRQGTIARYSWDDTAKVWEDYIDNYTPVGRQGKWDSPPLFKSVPTALPTGIPDADYIKFIYNEVRHKPHLVHSFEGIKLRRDLAFGAEIGMGLLEPMNKEKMFNYHRQRASNENAVEKIRVGQEMAPPAQYIENSHKHFESLKDNKQS